MKTQYICEICNRRHNTLEDAEKCEALPMMDFSGERYTDGTCHIPKMGEVVKCSYPASSWWHGDEFWSTWEEHGGRFLDGYYAKWVVVAKIPAGDRHEWRYILWTPSDINGNERFCWTGPNHTRTFPDRIATDVEMTKALKKYSSLTTQVPLL